MATDIALPMMGMFTKNWWLLLLKGLVAIIFGILALRRPGVTVAALVLLFGAYALVDGIFTLIAAFAGWRHREDRWLLVLEGLLGVGAGFVTLHAPILTAVALVFFIAAWALATGVLKIVEAIRLRREISGEFWLVLSGIASVVFAFLVMMRPAAGALAMAWLIGWFALIMGFMLVMLAFRMRSLRGRADILAGSPLHRRAA